MKRCNKCETDKPDDEFWTTARWCRLCCKEYRRNYYQNNKEKVRASIEKWRDENREKHNAYNKEYRDANKETVYAKSKQWRIDNPVRQFASASLGLKRRSGVLVSVAIDDVVALWDKQGGLCALSGLPMVQRLGRKGGGPFSPTIDRIVPELGYVNGNIRLLCYCVNAGRGTLDDDAYIQVCRAVLARN